jgi:hypothetical protein
MPEDEEPKLPKRIWVLETEGMGEAPRRQAFFNEKRALRHKEEHPGSELYTNSINPGTWARVD